MKTKLGISMAMFAGLTYILGYVSGYSILILIMGYVFICESEHALKKTVLRAMLLLVVFSVVSALVNLLPNLISVMDAFMGIFGHAGDIYIPFISNVVRFIDVVLSVMKKIIFLFMAGASFLDKDVKIPGLDGFIEKHLKENE